MINIPKLFWKFSTENQKQSLLSCFNCVDALTIKDTYKQRAFPKAFHHTKSIFIHIPKCAGTSIEKSLYSPAPARHQPAKYYQLQHPKEYESYYKFTLVRNPWDRLASAWHYLREKPKKNDLKWSSFLSEFDSFSDFVLNWLNKENSLKQIHLSPQYLFIENTFGAHDMNFIGKFEDITNSFEIIRKNVCPKATLLHLNKSTNSNNYRNKYNTQMVDKVAEVYRKDIELFNYSF